MAKDINFVRERRQELTKQQLKDATFFRYSLYALGVSMLCMVVVSGVSFWFGSRATAEAARQKQLEQTIVENESIEKTYVILVNKLSALASILELRRDKQAAIAYFSTVFGPDVMVKEISYNADDQIVSFGLESKDVFVLENVFKKLLESESTPEYTSVKPSNLSRGDKGKYTMQVTVTLAGK